MTVRLLDCLLDHIRLDGLHSSHNWESHLLQQLKMQQVQEKEWDKYVYSYIESEEEKIRHVKTK